MTVIAVVAYSYFSYSKLIDLPMAPISFVYCHKGWIQLLNSFPCSASFGAISFDFGWLHYSIFLMQQQQLHF